MKDPYESLPRPIVQMLEEIRSDNSSGAAEILQKGAGVYAAAACHTGGSAEQSLLMVDCISSALRESQPGIVGLLNLVRQVQKALHESGKYQPVELAAQTAAKFADAAALNATAAAAHASQLIVGNAVVLTHSRSSTVLTALLDAARSGRRFTLIATEGRPMLEGRQLAKSLSAAGVHVTVIVDAAAALMMNTVDLVLIGADRVTPRHVLNKIGSRMIALAARENGVPIFSLTDTSKFIGPSEAAHEAFDAPGSEVWPDPPAGIAIVNRYFEDVPIGLFTGVVTEGGSLDPVSAARLAADS